MNIFIGLNINNDFVDIIGLYGIPLVLVVFGLQIYTASLLGKSWTIATALDPHISRKNR